MIPGIWAYFAGCTFLVLVGMFAYRSLRNAKVMKGSAGRRYIAIGAVLFVLASIMDGLAMFEFPSMKLRFSAFFIWVIATCILLYAGFLIGRAIRRMYPGSLLGIAREHPTSMHNLIGIAAVAFIGTPIYALDVLYTPSGESSWLFVINTTISAFCFANLALASRVAHLSDVEPETGRVEKLPVRADILAVKAYGALINTFLLTMKPASGVFGETIEEYFEHSPILFEDCGLKPDGTMDVNAIAKNTYRIYKENRIQNICVMFSALSSKLLNLYGAMTSAKHAEELLTRSYLATQEMYGKSSTLFDVLRSLPDGVLQKERITLLPREELEARVYERTKELEASLEEKEVLLKEIHHRVKNNLQVISSLLNLQSGYINDEAALQMFKESQNRVRSMALIHEKLYQSEDLARIDFAEYIQDLANYLLRMYGTGTYRVRLRVNIEDVSLDIDTAIPCGLIVNELVSNSLKYAFPMEDIALDEQRESEAEIRVDVRSDNSSNLMLIVSDNGVGFPENLDFRETESLGLQLVNTLTEQLEGSIELDRTSGTTFKITFEKPESGREVWSDGRNPDNDC
ncbi:histidine kinase dimerization/phosphoacceptor domain -containing protein [Candidatus Poribacteria bacterium]